MSASKPTDMISWLFTKKERMTHSCFQEKMKSTINKWNHRAGWCSGESAAPGSPTPLKVPVTDSIEFPYEWLSRPPLHLFSFEAVGHGDRPAVRAINKLAGGLERVVPVHVWPHMKVYCFHSTPLPDVFLHTHTHPSACWDWIQHLLVLFAPSGWAGSPLGTRAVCVDGGHSWPRPNKIKYGTVERNSPPIPFDYPSILSSVPFSLSDFQFLSPSFFSHTLGTIVTPQWIYYTPYCL